MQGSPLGVHKQPRLPRQRSQGCVVAGLQAQSIGAYHPSGSLGQGLLACLWLDDRRHGHRVEGQNGPRERCQQGS